MPEVAAAAEPSFELLAGEESPLDTENSEMAPSSASGGSEGLQFERALTVPAKPLPEPVGGR